MNRRDARNPQPCLVAGPGLPSPVRRPRRRRVRGLSLIEVLVSLPIAALLLTATMVAIHASFRAYAAAAEEAGAQAATRLVTHRLLTLVRTSTAHGPLEPDAGHDPPVTLAGTTITSNFMQLIDPRGNLLTIEYREDLRQVWLISDDGGGEVQEQPLLGGVLSCVFTLTRRQNEEGLWVLERGNIDLAVEPDADNTLAIEADQREPIRVIASTMPRKLEE